MLGNMFALLLVYLPHLVAEISAENLPMIALPKLTTDYVSQCFHLQNGKLTCDWTMSQKTAPGNLSLNLLESPTLNITGMACLDFWYLGSTASNGSQLHALLKSSSGQVEIWNSSGDSTHAWKQVYVPLNVTEPATRLALEAFSSLDQHTIQHLSVRKGLCGNQCESNMEFWTNNVTRCLCSDGRLLCFPSKCPTGQNCVKTETKSDGFTTGLCTLHRHTDCSTFDGMLFRFLSPCTYVLVKTCHKSDNLPEFGVEVVKVQKGNGSLTIQEIVVSLGDIRVSLLRGQANWVVVNGIWRSLPLSLRNDTVHIKGNPAAVVLTTSFHLSVSYDDAGAVHIMIPSKYSRKVCGLCGNFNHVLEDDFEMPDGMNAGSATALAESWKSGKATASCEAIQVQKQCDLLEEARYASEQYCGLLRSSSGPFVGCLSVLGVESYFRACVLGMCSTRDGTVLCETLQAYTDMCQEAGVTLPSWRNATFCPIQCGENSYYNICATGCPEVCSSLDLPGSCGSCEERCECDTGFKLSGGKCVPAKECGCWSKGKNYEKDEMFVVGECAQQCKCVGNGTIQCTSMECAANEVCKEEDGVKGCYSFKPVTCSVYGDPHYITFDKLAYDFQGGCSYTLTTTCGGQSSVQFTVIGLNMHPADQNFTRSKLEAVLLQVDNLYMTLNQSGAVDVNGGPVMLPYSTSGLYGSLSVFVEGHSMILQTTFGLKIVLDMHSRLFLQVDETYKYGLCGLCGTYSGYQDDDFVMPGGQNATESFEFGDSWRVPDNECIIHPNDPRGCNHAETNEANKECSALIEDSFRACHERVHPSIYYNSCVYDFCDTKGDQNSLCESLKSYAAACQFFGVELPYWEAGTACDVSSTTLSPTRSSTTPNHTLCPISCNFDENTCGWEQLVQDGFDWKRHSGPTPSSQTGPNHDHTTGAGFYMYIEGDGVTHGDPARLLSPSCQRNGSFCLHFWYFMYGSATSMALNVYLLQTNQATKIWAAVHDHGPEWHLGAVDLNVSGPFQVIMEGIRGSTALSDVAIDDVAISFGSCSDVLPNSAVGTVQSFTTKVTPSRPRCNLDCSFDINLCNWSQMTTDTFDWTRNNASTPTQMIGPSQDRNGDHYIYIEATKVTYGDTARLISPQCSDTGPRCLQFWYRMYGSAETMGLHIYLVQNKVPEVIWWKRDNQGKMWHMAQVDFNTTGEFQMIIEGRRGSNETSDVALDDIHLYDGHCSDLSGTIPTFPANPGINATERSVTVPTSTNQSPTTDSTSPGLAVTTTAAPLPVGNVTLAPGVNLTTAKASLPATANASAPGVNVTTTAAPLPPVANVTLAPGVNLTTAKASLPATANASAPGVNVTTTVLPLPPVANVTLAPGVNLTTKATSAPGVNVTTTAASLPPVANVTLAPGVDLTTEATSAPGVNVTTTAAPLPPVANVTLAPGVNLTTAKASLPATANASAPGVNVTTTTVLPLPPVANVTLAPGVNLTTKATSAPGVNVTTTAASLPPVANVTLAPGVDLTTEATSAPGVNVTTTAASLPQVANVTTSPRVNVTTPSGEQSATTPGNVTMAPVQPHPVCQLNCDFETDLCQWSQLLTDVFDWERGSGSTPTMITGPSSDHTTGGGHYLYIEANRASLGDTARLISPECSDLGPQCLQFWYHMYGSADTMGLNVYLLQDSRATLVWTQRNDQGNVWHLAQVDLVTDGSFEIIFEGRRGSTDQSDVAMDDISIHRGFCKDPVNSVTTAASASTTAHQSSFETSLQPQTVEPQPPVTEGNGTGSLLTTTKPGSSNETVPHPQTTIGSIMVPTEAKPDLTTSPELQATNASGGNSHATPTTLSPGPTQVSTPSCGENSHYTTCLPLCTPTCSALNGSAQCNTNDCLPGCACDEGFVKKGIACVPLEECGCVDNSGTKHQFNDVWYTSHCNQKCECEKHDGRGKIDCDDDECGDDAVCLQNELGQFYCKSTDFSECKVERDPKYKTFDKLKHDFAGTHYYVLVRTKNLPKTLPDFYVEGANTCTEDESSEEEDGSKESSGEDGVLGKKQELKIKVYNHTVDLKQNRKVFVDGQLMKAPVSQFPGLEIKMRSRVYLKTDFGLSVEFDGRCKAEIIVPHLYKGRLEGLCGNFDGQKGNDKTRPDGTLAKNIKEFGESWRV